MKWAAVRSFLFPLCMLAIGRSWPMRSEDGPSHRNTIPGYPEDVANPVLFLCCDESRLISGKMINVDGGVAAKI